ncbi:hypothetical protein RB2465 [Rhodopirellula baltica SH 1]|uniref:Uncharacterized protein n=1 Tax=Rhodopirellula baltica (strain DSM 10527 / NCIMB 13988 / SH1) TaxID=243090 RepID=Q7UVS8_RHOBA|nr:hypothetical protein RB2465 [Rhodopirellula baltica SH 1]
MVQLNLSSGSSEVRDEKQRSGDGTVKRRKSAIEAVKCKEPPAVGLGILIREY